MNYKTIDEYLELPYDDREYYDQQIKIQELDFVDQTESLHYYELFQAFRAYSKKYSLGNNIATPQFNKLIKKILTHPLVMKALRRSDNKEYYYMTTFTLKPTIKPAQYDSIETYIINRLKETKLNITEAHIAREHTKQGVPHWHACIKASKYIAKSRFITYVKKFGNVDHSKNKTNSLEDMLEYTNKEVNSIRII